MLEARFWCAWCGEPNDTTVDASVSPHQSYTEDCQVCCRPNVLHIEVSNAGSDWEVSIDSEPEDDWS